MKLTAKMVVVMAIGLALMISAGCASGPKHSGFLGEYTRNLQPGPEGGAKELWLKPGVNWAKYDKLMIDSVVFFVADDSEYKGIDPQFMKEMADKFNQTLIDTLKPSYPIVGEPGPDVGRIRFAITGIEQSRPVLSGITTIVPVGLAINVVKRGTTGTWTGSGATSAELMALDSTTNDVIAVAADQKSAGFTERFTKWGSADDAFKFWAGRIKTFLDSFRPNKQ